MRSDGIKKESPATIASHEYDCRVPPDHLHETYWIAENGMAYFFATPPSTDPTSI
jgi:hypothetical protein